jgi:hypothetical protein
VPAQSRATLLLDAPDLRDSVNGFAIRVTSTNGVPVTVARAMWWPGVGFGDRYWYEGHAETGVSETAPRWVFAEGEVRANLQTYVLVGNPGATGGQIGVTLRFDDGTTASRVFSIGATSRTTIDVGASFPASFDRSFQVDVSSVGAPLPLVVERARYSSTDGVFWSGGSVLLGTPVR